VCGTIFEGFQWGENVGPKVSNTCRAATIFKQVENRATAWGALFGPLWGTPFGNLLWVTPFGRPPLGAPSGGPPYPFWYIQWGTPRKRMFQNGARYGAFFFEKCRLLFHAFENLDPSASFDHCHMHPKRLTKTLLIRLHVGTTVFQK